MTTFYRTPDIDRVPPEKFTTAQRMIRHLAILVLATSCLAVSTSAGNATKEIDPVKGRKWFYNLLGIIFQHGQLDPDLRGIVNDWDLGTNLDGGDQKWKVAKRKLYSCYKSGMLPRRRIFSVYYPDQLEEAILIFKAFYNAPTYPDLMRVVYWAHTHLNENQFTYALYVALVHVEKIKWIPIPQPYEVNPELFFNSDVMQQVYDYKMSLIYGEDKTETDLVKIVEGKYSNWYIKDTLDNEDDLAYFMEDVGLNTWYCYFTLRYPFWMSDKEYPSVDVGGRGEIYHYLHKKISNRYRLERLSHGLEEVDPIDWDEKIAVGYSPYMSYRNGMHLPSRPERTRIPVWKNRDLQKLREYESRINQVVDSGFMLTTDGKLENIRSNEGFIKFGSLVQGNIDSLNKNYYGSVDALSRRIIGFSPEPQNRYQILPGPVENFATSLRDPAFYRLWQRIHDSFFRFKEHMVPYTKEELNFDGVSIESASIVGKELVTYMEEVDTLIETVKYTDCQNVSRTSKIKVRQNRLNHKPFTYEINIKSVKEATASIRIFLGPKYNVHGEEISNNYANFFMIDHFLHELKNGSNIIQRDSTEHAWDAPDYISSQKFDKPLQGLDLFLFENRRFGFPRRLSIPRGKVDGMPIQFFIYVSEFDGLDPKAAALGFPLDRPIFDFDLPNMRFFDTVIYHKKNQTQI